MGTKTLSVSIPLDLVEFLQKNPGLKPSSMLQRKIREVMELRKDLEATIKAKDIMIRNLNTFIIEKSLWEEFQTWKHKHFKQ